VERLAVVIDLRGLRRRRRGETIGAGKKAVEVIGNAVSRYNHTMLLDAIESARRSRGACPSLAQAPSPAATGRPTNSHGLRPLTMGYSRANARMPIFADPLTRRIPRWKSL